MGLAMSSLRITTLVRWWRFTAGCNSINCQVYLGSNFQSQLGVAADGAGDVFIGDFLDGEAVEIPAGCTSTACQKVVYNPGEGSNPVDLTADATGDLFIADFGLKSVIEVPAGCTNSSCQVTIGSGWNQPDDVAVDAAGDVFVADEGLQEIVEVPAGCLNVSCQIVLVSGVEYCCPRGRCIGRPGSSMTWPNERVFEVTRSQPPAFNFALTNVGSTSTDSPQLVSIQNVGNQPLTGSVISSAVGANFLESGSCNCRLLAGAGRGLFGELQLHAAEHRLFHWLGVVQRQHLQPFASGCAADHQS